MAGWQGLLPRLPRARERSAVRGLRRRLGSRLRPLADRGVAGRGGRRRVVASGAAREEGHEGKVVIDPQSLQSAISVRYSDIKVVSIGAVPELDYPEEKP